MEIIKREIRPLKAEDLDAYIDNYLNAYPAGKDMSEEGLIGYKMSNLQSLEEFEDVNYFGMFENDKLIGQMKLIDFDINLFGEMKKATGLMALAVHPMYKKRGVARGMVEFFQDYTANSGGLVSMLLPFRIDFYRKMGYGCGTKLEEYHIPTVQLPQCTREKLFNSRLLTMNDIDKVIECYSDFVRKNHGAVLKFSEEKRNMLEDREIRRIGVFRDETLVGYAAFNFLPASDTNYTMNTLDVRELVYDNSDTLRTLLGGLKQQSDLCQTAVIRTGEPDFYHLFDSPQSVNGGYFDFGFLETNTAAVGTMYKICNVPMFVNETSHRKFYAANLKVKLEVFDEMHEKNDVCVIEFHKDEHASFSGWRTIGKGDCDDIASDVTVSCYLSDLSALFMGSMEFSAMVRLGLAKISDKSFVSILDNIFHCEQKPFTNTDY